MLNHEQLLKLIRDKVEHPATPRELLQRLKIPRDERVTFKRHLKALVAAGELIQIRGERFGLPGMAILQFAFGTDPQAHDFRPHNYPRNRVVYTGTHDNDTTVGWWTGEAGHSTRSKTDV